MKFISGSSNPDLTQKIAQQLSCQIINCEIDKFANGEKRVWVKENVEGERITLVQSFSQPVDENIFEALLIIDALERAGARSIDLVIPWMGYSLQDKVFRPGEPIAAKVIADVFSNSHVKRVYLLDLHNTSIPGFFSVPTEHLSALDTFAQYVKDNFDLNKTIVLSPDFGGIKKASAFSIKLNLELINLNKKRDLKTGKVTVAGVNGEVKNKNILIFDDVINTGRTLIEVANYLKEKGAISIHFFATHGLFAGDALEKIEKSQVDKVIITNSITQPIKSSKLIEMDISNLFSKALEKWIR